MFKELFTEAFDNPYKFKKAYDDEYDTDYHFEVGDIKYSISLARYDNKTTLSFSANGRDEMTDADNPFRIFATVLEVIKKEKKRILKYGEFENSAYLKDKSRVTLYTVMNKKLKKLLGYDKLKIEKDAGYATYTFTNKGK